ncbi:MAG: agmatinase family protein [Gammaproteobacteria bacterium]|nr:agmatinase family protein [Gammaproteobacteria bacterium]MCW5583036.1 agmatinase family protein [Gammaproteobacteria bacterium]
MDHFDPNAAALENSGIFGLPFSVSEAKLVLLPVPWEVTTSYGGGTSQGPQAIFDASKQIDLFDFELGNFFQAGIAMLNISPEIKKWNKAARNLAKTVIQSDGLATDTHLHAALEKVNAYSVKLNHYVYTETKKLLSQEKIVGVIGGDHSSPFGAIQAILETHPQMGILHIDAHADLRKAFEGFEYSHASIMYNVISKTSLATLVQVGIRDFCEEEYNFIRNHKTRIYTFFDSVLFEQKITGKGWPSICDEIIQSLPKKVYISFDIDGLDPRFCPHTGTPVPGGLDFHEAIYLIKKVVQSGRKIIGFDLNEVSPGITKVDNDFDSAAEWDANVGARLLYKLCGYALID